MITEILDEIRKTYVEPDYFAVDDEQRAEGIREHIQTILKRFSGEIQKEFRETIEQDKSKIEFWHDVILDSLEARKEIKERKRRSLYFEDAEGNIYVYGEKISYQELQKIS